MITWTGTIVDLAREENEGLNKKAKWKTRLVVKVKNNKPGSAPYKIAFWDEYGDLLDAQLEIGQHVTVTGFHTKAGFCTYYNGESVEILGDEPRVIEPEVPEEKKPLEDKSLW